MAALAASFGVFWTAAQVYSTFQLTIFSDVSKNSLLVTNMGLASLTSALVVASARAAWIIYRGQLDHKQTFDDTLVDMLDDALKARNYSDVIRIGDALNRPLFEAGNFVTRLKIGRIVEEAAALSGRKEIQIGALIDSIGWSLVELGNYEDAKKNIQHGIDLCEGKDAFYTAKGLRHLGVIERRAKRYDAALSLYKKSLKTADKIEDAQQREVLIAGLHYAFGSLYFFMDEYRLANDYIGRAISSFDKLNDEYRLNMSYVTKGDIEAKQGLADKAKDTYRKVLREANRNTEKLQIARSNLGLAEIYISEHDWGRARASLAEAEKIDLGDFKDERERLKRLRSTLPIQQNVQRG
jgi:tetratricopeptide (TPR) repeat protein